LVSRNGRYLYITNYDIASVSTLQINSATGGLKYLSTTQYGIKTYDRPFGLATSMNGDFVFAGEPSFGATNMGIFSAAKSGLLTSLGTFPMLNWCPAWIAAK
jgi:6-phosphogluconolactonase (cycloisomerase 2 family)